MSTLDPIDRRPDRRSSERRRADEALRKSEEHYRALFDHCRDCVYLHDFQGRFLDANPATLDLLGYGHEELLAISFPSLLDGDQLARALETLDGLKETGSQKAPTEYRLRRKTGEYVHVESTASVIFRDGQPYAVLNIGRDITERVQAGEARRRSEDTFSKAFHGSPDAVLITRVSDGRVVEVNEGFTRLSGFERDEALRSSTLALDLWAEPGDRERCIAGLESDGSVSGMDFRFRVKSGEILQGLYAGALISVDGEPHILSVVRDITELKQAEEAAKSTVRFQQVLMDAVPSPIFYKDAECVYIGGNKAFERYVGLTSEQFIGKTVYDISPVDLAEKYDRADRGLLNNPGVQTYEASVVYADGTRHDVIFNKATFANAQGNVAGLIGVILDITERKQAEEALRESEERYRTLFERNLDGVLMTVPDGRITAANPVACRMLQMTVDEICAAGRARLLQPDPTLADMVKERDFTGELEGELTFIRKDGSTFPAEFSSVVVPDATGAPRSFVIFRDITERKRAEEALHGSHERFRLANRATYDGIWDWDLTTNALWWNENFQALFGYAPEEIEPGIESWTNRIHPEDVDRVAMGIHAAIDSGQRFWSDQYRFRRKDGTYADIEDRGHIGRKPDGTPIRMIGAMRDITVRMRAEEERLDLERRLQQSQKLESLGVLAGGIAHDFNNILMAVLGNAELALSDLSPSAPARENLLEITKASRRASELCRQMLAYSGRGHFVVEHVDLSALVEDMVHLLQSTISKKALLSLHLEKYLPPLLGDASQLSQVIMNLVINASEAMGEKDGVITISTGVMECSAEYLREGYLEPNLPPGFYLALEVSDTGAGMDTETQDRIFEPFFTTKFTGRGLGLSAVLGIVRGHKGALRVYSEPGRGTTFKLLFPAADAERGDKAHAHALQTGDWRGAGTILLVDDEETIRAVGKHMLERLGFQVLTAADGRQALEIYRQHMDEITLVLLDLTMPRMDGEETFRELRVLNPDARVVISSGYSEQDVTSRFAGEGLVGFVPKPYTLDLLRERLRTALAD